MPIQLPCSAYARATWRPGSASSSTSPAPDAAHQLSLSCPRPRRVLGSPSPLIRPPAARPQPGQVSAVHGRLPTSNRRRLLRGDSPKRCVGGTAIQVGIANSQDGHDSALGANALAVATQGGQATPPVAAVLTSITRAELPRGRLGGHRGCALVIPRLVTRTAWGARRPRSTQRLEPSAVRFLVVHYSAMHSDEQADHRNCAARVRGIQNYHMDSHGWDIAYNWLVCKHGYVFRGGWGPLGGDRACERVHGRRLLPR